MGAAKKLEVLPEEKFIQDALREGRAFKTRISLKAIGKPDPRFQARVDPLDFDHVRRLARILEEAGELHPIVVFFSPRTNRYLVADGFHRFDAYRRHGATDIPAYQVDGDEGDALSYCTMCNRLAMKGRTKEDVAKAVEMLLADETWWHREDSWVANHVGCTSGLVSKTRSRLACKARPIPSHIRTARGKPKPYRPCGNQLDWRHIRVPVALGDRLDRLVESVSRDYTEGRIEIPTEHCERIPAWLIIQMALDKSGMDVADSDTR